MEQHTEEIHHHIAPAEAKSDGADLDREDLKENFASLRSLTQEYRERLSLPGKEKITATDIDINSRLTAVKIMEILRAKIEEADKRNSDTVHATEQLRENFHQEIGQQIGKMGEVDLLPGHRRKVEKVFSEYLHARENMASFRNYLSAQARINERTIEEELLTELSLPLEEISVEFSPADITLRFTDRETFDRFGSRFTATSLTTTTSFQIYTKIGRWTRSLSLIGVYAGVEESEEAVNAAVGHERRHTEFSFVTGTALDKEQKKAEHALEQLHEAARGDVSMTREEVKECIKNFVEYTTKMALRDEILAQAESGTLKSFIREHANSYTTEIIAGLLQSLAEAIGEEHVVNALKNDPLPFLENIAGELTPEAQEAASYIRRFAVEMRTGITRGSLEPVLDFLSFEPMAKWGILLERLKDYRKKWLKPLDEAIENKKQQLLGVSHGRQRELHRILGDNYDRLNSQKRDEIEEDHYACMQKFADLQDEAESVPWEMLTLNELALHTKAIQAKFAQLSSDTENRIAAWKKMSAE